MRDWSEERLVRYARNRACAGAAFGVLYDRYRPPCRGWAVGYVGDSDADDITHEAFLSLWKSIPGLTAPYRVGAFLKKAVRWKALDFLRRRQRCQLIDPIDIESFVSDVPVAPDLGDAAEIWTQAKNCLSDREARVLTMRVKGGMSCLEIAGQEKLKENNIRRILHRARFKIKKNEFFR